MKLVLSRRALRRLEEIADYLNERNSAAARRVQQAIHDAFALLLTYPEAGRAVELGVRILVVPRFPYVIYYKVDEVAEVVHILTVRHAAQDEQ